MFLLCKQGPGGPDGQQVSSDSNDGQWQPRLREQGQR